jgi:hypothetical protein
MRVVENLALALDFEKALQIERQGFKRRGGSWKGSGFCEKRAAN